MKEKEKIELPEFEFNNGAELEKWIRNNAHIDYTGLIAETKDGRFICIKDKAIRLDNKYKPWNMDDLKIPKIGYEPHADRAILHVVSRQDQFTEGGTFQPSSFNVTIRNETKQRSRMRFFVVKAGRVFSEQATGEKSIQLVCGDEVILADHLDGLPHMPVIEDPTGVITNSCASIHYSEIVGYIKHVKE